MKQLHYPVIVCLLLLCFSTRIFSQVTPSLWYDAQNFNSKNQTWTYKGITVKAYDKSKKIPIKERVQNFNPALGFNRFSRNFLYNDNLNGHTFLSSRNNTVFIVQNLKNNGVAFQFGKKGNHRLGSQFSGINNGIRFDFPNDVSGKIINNFKGIGKMCIWGLLSDHSKNSFTVNGGNLIEAPCVDSFSNDANDRLRIGRSSLYDARETIEAYSAEMDLSEILIFNTSLSYTDKSIWESYLGIKYGITINDGNFDYLSSDGSVIWASDNIFKTNMVGIGKDRGTSLDQRIAIAEDGNLTVSTEAAINNQYIKTNKQTKDVLDDKQFILIADNKESIYNKVWKVQNTGINRDLYMKFDISGFPREKKYIYVYRDLDISKGVLGIFPLEDGFGKCTFPIGTCYMRLNAGIFVSVYTDKNEYCVGEKIKVHINIFSEGKLNSISVNTDKVIDNSDKWNFVLDSKSKHYYADNIITANSKIAELTFIVTTDGGKRFRSTLKFKMFNSIKTGVIYRG